MSENKKKGERINLASLWEHSTRNCSKFHVSNKLSFGELRAILKEFKEENDVGNDDNIVFMLFEVDLERIAEDKRSRAPQYNLILKKDNYVKKD